MNISAKILRKNIWERFPSGIWLMMGLDTLLTIGWSSASPFLALYLYNVRGLSMSLVGMIFLVGGLMTGATNLLGGMLSDRFGRRRLLIAIAAVSTLFSLFLALLIGMSAPILLIIAFFIATRSINGTIGPTTGAIVADLSPRDRLAESYAVVRIGGNVGFAIGPAIGGYLMGFISYGWLFSISAVVSLTVTALVYFFLRETYGGSKAHVNLRSTLAVAKDRSFLFFVIVSILLVLSIGHLGTTLSVFTVDRLGFTTAQYGLLLTLNGLIVVVLQYPVTRIVERFTKAKGLIIGSLFYVAGYSLLGWIAGFNWAILVIILITAGEVTLTPISSAVVAESAPTDKRGRYMGFFTLGQTVGFALSPLFGGVLLDNFPTESRLLWGIIGSVGIVSAVGFAVWGRFYKTNRTGQNAP
jgi:MFS family permease